MGRIFGWLLVVAGIWVGVEIYTAGLGGAFGGTLSRLGIVADRDEDTAGVSVIDRVRDSAERSRDDGMARYDSQLGE